MVGVKVWLHGDIYAIVENGKIKEIVDEGYRFGGKNLRTYERIDFDGRRLTFKSFNGVEFSYDTETDELEVRKPFKYRGSLGEFLKVADEVRSLPQISERLKGIGNVIVSPFNQINLRAPYIYDYIESDEFTDDQFWRVIDGYERDGGEPDYTGVFIENRSEEPKRLRVEFDIPDGFVVFYRHSGEVKVRRYREPIEIELEPTKTLRLEVVPLAKKRRVSGELGIKVYDGDELVGESRSFVFS